MTSEAKFKIDVTDLKDAASIIQKLQPKSYHFDTANYSFMNLPSTDQRGFISDDVELIAKDLVKTYTFPAQYDSTGKLIHESFDVKYMNYIGLIPLLVQVAQDQQQQITDLKTQVDGCCSNKMKTANDDGGSPANQVVELKTDATNYLGQSVPNPHGSQCTIPYSIDANVITAEIVFVDELGRVIQRVEIVTRGKGQLTVLSSNLEDGVYNYSLVLEGKTIDTKRMIKQH
ncbi:MAG: tail fiber domain-containing protein [Chitinophagales bacterium]|nr:tail fiber domain-containing protein [Chitinophagales bacterium]